MPADMMLLWRPRVQTANDMNRRVSAAPMAVLAVGRRFPRSGAAANTLRADQVLRVQTISCLRCQPKNSTTRR